MEKGMMIIKADGSEKFVPSAKRPELEVLQKAVDGYIEYTKCVYKGKKRSMIVNEEGAINPGFEFNKHATLLFWAAFPFQGAHIYGTAIILIGYR